MHRVCGKCKREMASTPFRWCPECRTEENVKRLRRADKPKPDEKPKYTLDAYLRDFDAAQRRDDDEEWSMFDDVEHMT